MNRILILSSLSLLLLACQPVESSLTLTNPLDLDRQDAPIRISMDDLTQRGMLAANLWAPYDEEGQVIPYQYDDLDQDGKPDELFFLVDLAAGETETISLKPALKAPDFPARTHLRLGKKTPEGIVPLTEADRLDTADNKVTAANFQFEGVGWENEEVAFRNYLDLRNGIDIFGKTKAELLLDRVGLKGDASYHELLDWGMDVLKVGNSLGAGSVAFWYQDSLIRLTSTDADYRMVLDKPLRSRFELRFRGVDLGDQQVDVVHTIEILPGTYGYDATISFSEAVDLQVAVGIVDLYELDAQTLTSEETQVLYTYGLQSENKDSLGMALFVPSAGFSGSFSTDTVSKEIPDTYAMLLSPEEASYRFYAGWERSSEQFADQAAFAAYLQRDMSLRDAPITISWIE